jgi:hypothetical protein
MRICKRARVAEQNTKTTNDAYDAQPMMIRSIRIVQKRDKVPSETTTGTAQPKRSSPSTGIALEKKPAPELPLTAHLTSLSEAREKFRQLNLYKYPEEQLKQVTRRLTHLAPHCTPHPCLIDFMHGSPCAGRQRRPLHGNSYRTPSSSLSVP